MPRRRTSYGDFFKPPPPSTTASLLASRIPDDATLDALLQRRSRARGRGGGHATRLIDTVEHKWTVLYAS